MRRQLRVAAPRHHVALSIGDRLESGRPPKAAARAAAPGLDGTKLFVHRGRSARRASVARVLVLEDDEQVRVLAEGILQDNGHEVLTAGTREEALALLKTDQQIDLLFTDIRLAGVDQDGLEVAQQARALRPKIRALYTTGAGVSDGTRALFVDGWVFLAKPYTPDDLIKAVGNALR